MTVEIQNDAPDRPLLSTRKVRMRVDKSYGGLPSGIRELEVWTGSGGGNCGFPFEAGKSYLVQAWKSGDHFSTNICGFTRDIESAGAVLQSLDRGLVGRPMPSLTGLIESYVFEIRGWLTARARHRHPNHRIRIRSGDRTLETLSDKDGVYSFDSLPPGDYQILPDLPPGTRHATFIGLNDTPGPVQIGAGACQAYDVRLFPAGAIEGGIHDASGKLKRVRVYLLPSESDLPVDTQQTYHAFPRDDGSFQFLHVPPGRYHLLVNPENSIGKDEPYPRTYFPGVTSRAAAGVVKISGRRISRVDIRLNRAASVRPVKVYVTWLGGRPVDHLTRVRATVSNDPDSSAIASGFSPVSIGLQPGQEYMVEAEVVCQTMSPNGPIYGPTFRSGQLRLDPGSDVARPKMTVPATGCPETQQ